MDKLDKIKTKLKECHQTKAQAEAKRRQAQEQLEAAKSHYLTTKSQWSKAKANGESALLVHCVAPCIQISDY